MSTTLLPPPGATSVEVAPGQFQPIASRPPEMLLSRYLLAELVPAGGGLYRICHRPMLRWQGIGSESLERLGIACSESTMHRLGRAGFIRIRCPSPMRYEFELESWFAHCDRVEADAEEFWSRRSPDPDKSPTNREKYGKAI